MTPKIQFGLPVYNGSNFLAAALDSLLAQTWTDFEILISDNGSTDSTQQIAEKYAAADERVRYFRYETNRGAAWNFNNAARLADAPYFAWAAHDDLRHPEFLTRTLEVLEADEELICAYAATQAVDEEGNSVGGYYVDKCHRMEDRPSVRFSKILGVYPMHVVFGLMRHDRLMRTSLWGGYASADRVLVAELALHGKIHELPEQLFYRRWHRDVSWTIDKSEREYAIWYDPKNADRKLNVPKLQRGLEYAKTIHRARLSPVESANAYRHLAEFAAWDQGVLSVARQVSKRLKPLGDADPAMS